MASDKNNLKASESDLADVYKFYFEGKYKKALLALDNLTHEFPCDPLLYIIGGDCYVPLNEDNTDYQNILKWVEEGNTIQEAD